MPIQTFSCQVIRTDWLTQTVFSLRFRPEPRIPFLAGQFISIRIPGAGPGGRDLRRAYSIASPPDWDEMEVCVKWLENGPGTTYLKNLEAGQSFQCTAPYGDFVYKHGRHPHSCFIATGTGVSPFRSIVQSSTFQNAHPKSTLVLYGCRNETEVLYRNEFKSVGQNVSWQECFSKEPQAASKPDRFLGRVTEWLKQSPPLLWNETDFYLCGSGEMIKEAREILATHGVAKDSIHYEKYY